MKEKIKALIPTFIIITILILVIVSGYNFYNKNRIKTTNLWDYKIESGDVIPSTLLNDKQTLYFIAKPFATVDQKNKKKLYSLDAITGKQNWSVEFMSGINHKPIVLDDKIYVLTGINGNEVTVYETQSGREVWKYTDSATIITQILPTSKHLLVMTSEQKFKVISNDTKRLVWEYRLEPSTEGTVSEPFPFPKEVGDHYILPTKLVSDPLKTKTLTITTTRFFLAFDKNTGKKVGQASSKECTDSHTFVGTSSNLYFMGGNQLGQGICALEVDTNKLAWKNSSINPSQIKSLTFDDSSMYFVESGRLKAIDKKSGKELWVNKNMAYSTNASFSHENKLYFIKKQRSEKGYTIIYFDKTTGIASKETVISEDSDFFASESIEELVTDNGKIYVLGKNGIVRALEFGSYRLF